MLKKTFLAKHGPLVLRTHANFSSPFPSAHRSQKMFAAKILKYLTLAGTMHSSLFLFFFPGVLCITLQKGCQSQVKKLPFSLQSL